MSSVQDNLPTKDASASPSYVRYLILLAMCLAASVAYLCRNSIGVAESTIRDELGLSEDQMGWVMSSFFLAYALGQLPLGWLGAKLGSRTAIAWFAACWSVATATMGLAAAGSIGVLLGSRVANGVAQAGLFPACTSSIGRWFPSTNRAFASGSLASFMSIGGAIGVAVTGYLIAQFGWRGVFTSYGVVGVMFSILFYLWFRNSPAEHGWVNEEECRLIGEFAGGEAKGGESESSWSVLLYRQTWWICGQQFCRAAGQIFFASWFATYLQETREVSVAKSGLLTSMPLLSLVAGGFIGGAVSDYVLQKTGRRRLARSGVAVTCMTLCAACVFGAYPIQDPALAVALISLGTFFAAIGGPCGYTVTIDMGGRHVAMLFATMNMVGNLGAFAFIRAVPEILKVSSWDSVLAIFGVLYLGAAVFWMLVNPDRRLDGAPLVEK